MPPVGGAPARPPEPPEPSAPPWVGVAATRPQAHVTSSRKQIDAGLFTAMPKGIFPPGSWRRKSTIWEDTSHGIHLRPTRKRARATVLTE